MLPDSGPTIFTVGHSSRPLAEFIGLLRAHGVTGIADVRKMPRSRSNPQFNSDTLAQALAEAGIGYLHIPALGGLRRRAAHSPNGGWRNPSFQGYADYMQTPAFDEGLQAIIDLAKDERLAVMCAEAVPWRCHRSLIADALVVRGFSVADILSDKRVDPHKLRPWARVQGTRITYPAEATSAPPVTPRGTNAPNE